MTTQIGVLVRSLLVLILLAGGYLLWTFALPPLTKLVIAVIYTLIGFVVLRVFGRRGGTIDSLRRHLGRRPVGSQVVCGGCGEWVETSVVTWIEPHDDHAHPYCPICYVCYDPEKHKDEVPASLVRQRYGDGVYVRS